MEYLPKELQNIVIDYKHNLEIAEHRKKFQKTLDIIESIEYEINSGNSCNIYSTIYKNYDNNKKTVVYREQKFDQDFFFDDDDSIYEDDFSSEPYYGYGLFIIMSCKYTEIHRGLIETNDGVKQYYQSLFD